MDVAGIREEVAVIEIVLREVPDPELDLSDPGIWDKMRAEPPLVDRAGVRAEATDALRALLDAYDAGPESVRQEVREVFRQHALFTGSVDLPHDWTTAEEFRRRLLLLSAVDQGADTRDELITLWGTCERARRLGIDVEAVLLEVAGLSSDVDHYGMGSMRKLIMRGRERH
uniref:ATP phosphoribosyltransferase regulatory subunit n=1 Tax=Paractinoplanes polyasparticus TaxID=2856853 RepID=UPI001C8540B3|nr:ATP phosphoribosyltransferase regulatory subunit [Actinoplanes polyasparticus]